MQRYCRQTLREGPFYRPGPSIWQSVLQSNRGVPSTFKSIHQPKSLLSEDIPPSLTGGSSSAQGNSETPDPSALPNDTWTSDHDGTQFCLAGSINLSGEQSLLTYVGSIFEGRLYMNKKSWQQVGLGNVLNDAEYQVVLPEAVLLANLELPFDDCKVLQISHIKPMPGEKPAGQNRGNQLLEEQFRLLFETSPSILTLYSPLYRVHGRGDCGHGAQGGSRGRRNPLDPAEISGSDNKRQLSGNNKPNRDDNGQNDKNDKNREDLARKRYLEGFPEPEFLCVMYVGDQDRALAAGCAFHHPSIMEIFRHLKNLHYTRIPQIDEALWRELEGHSPKKNMNQIALWKKWHELLFGRKEIRPGSWYYNSGPSQPPLHASRPINESSAGSSQPFQVPHSPLDDQADSDSIEAAARFAAEEASESPDIVIAIESHHDDVRRLRRKQDMDLEEVEERYQEDLSRGRKRAREARAGGVEQVEQEFERAKTEVDDQFKRKIARCRQARESPLVHAAHEALHARLQISQGEDGPGAEVRHPYLQLPPRFSTGPGRSRATSDVPTMDDGNATPPSTNAGPISSRDGRLSPQTPGMDAIPVDPQIRESSTSSTSVSDRQPGFPMSDPASQMDYPSPELPTEHYCLEKSCHGKPLQDERFCGIHYSVGRHDSEQRI